MSANWFLKNGINFQSKKHNQIVYKSHHLLCLLAVYSSGIGLGGFDCIGISGPYVDSFEKSRGSSWAVTSGDYVTSRVLCLRSLLLAWANTCLWSSAIWVCSHEDFKQTKMTQCVVGQPETMEKKRRLTYPLHLLLDFTISILQNIECMNFFPKISFTPVSWCQPFHQQLITFILQN